MKRMLNAFIFSFGPTVKIKGDSADISGDKAVSRLPGFWYFGAFHFSLTDDSTSDAGLEVASNSDPYILGAVDVQKF